MFNDDSKEEYRSKPNQEDDEKYILYIIIGLIVCLAFYLLFSDAPQPVTSDTAYTETEEIVPNPSIEDLKTHEIIVRGKVVLSEPDANPKSNVEETNITGNITLSFE